MFPGGVNSFIAQATKIKHLNNEKQNITVALR
jgi:hypothetical protein